LEEQTATQIQEIRKRFEQAENGDMEILGQALCDLFEILLRQLEPKKENS
jgi:hypothetical protein